MRKFIVLVFMAVIAVPALGCGVHLMPSASATLLTQSMKKESGKVVPVGGVVMEKDCYSSVLFYLVGFGNHAPSHERLIAKILEKHKSDVLLDADLSYSEYHIPLLFQSRCAKVKGQPARYTAESEVEK